MNTDPWPAGPEPAQNPELIDALAGFDASASLAIAHRTRRAVRDAASNLREDRLRRRRNKGLALLAALGFLMLLTPALWSEIDELFAGEHLSDLPTMVSLFAMTLFSAVVAALIAGWRNHLPARTGKRNF